MTALKQPLCFVVSVRRLRHMLASISIEKEMWWILPSIANRSKARLCIVYRSLRDQYLVNDIAYSYPIIVGETHERDALVCIHPAAPEAEYIGLYLEPDGLKQDCFEDFQRICNPLLEALKQELRYDGFSLERCVCLKDPRPDPEP